MAKKPEQKKVKDAMKKRPKWGAGTKDKVHADDDGICHICGDEVSKDDMHIDHAVSWSDIKKEAANDPDLWEADAKQLKKAKKILYRAEDNLRASHAECNQRKGSQSWYDAIKNNLTNNTEKGR